MRLPVLLALICLSLIAQGCTISYYRLRDEIPRNATLEKTSGCDFNYTFKMVDYRRFLSIGNQPNPRAAEDLDSYMTATQEVLNQKACKAKRVEDQDKADFKIDIVRAPLLSALPQEWLTGLTVGAIPSWGTRYGEFRYTFTKVPAKRSFTYFVDRPAYNHIILFPVFWLSYFGPEEIDLYKRALTNFLENS